MPINSNIALGVQPLQVADPMARYSQFAGIQSAQNQNALAQYQLSAAQRADEQQNKLYEAAQQPDFKLDFQSAIQYGAPGIAAYKAQQEASNAQTEGQIKSTKLLTDKLSLLPEAYKRADTPEAYLALHQSIHADPVLGPYLKSVGATPEKGLATLQNAIQTGNFEKLRMGSMQSVSQILDSMKPMAVAASSSVYNPQTGTFTQAPAAPITPKETDLQLNYKAAKDQGFVGSIFEYEKKLKEASRAPAQPVAPTITQIVDPTNPNQMITIDAKRYQGGGAGSAGVIGVAGKEPGAALRTNKVEQGKTQLADDLENLRASFQTLDKLRAVPSTERGPLSNVTSAIASSRVGQITGQAFATEAQVERDVINSARSRLVNSIKNATGMSAQQLNSNVELQTMLKSISDPGQSYQSAIRIIDDIERAYVTGNGTLPKRNQPAAAPAASAGGLTPAEQAELDQLRSRFGKK